ncbi:MAG: hypothetical protein IPP97_00955 [Candidatus Obscuribacter sp.]|nr:hypothetical protein [Candidatus Obscuribacter sp.]MBP6593795.1 hypothetical protein [Candidatus Obscuribacter sp.]MBP7577341.1 hypothetical protein [Candidatus Obscuribacter sp.]
MAPIALAQTTDAPTAEAQAAAPSWNDSNDLMVLPRTEKAKVETKVETKAPEPIKVSEPKAQAETTATKTSVVSESKEAEAAKAQSAKEAALQAKADAVKAKLEAAKAKMEAKKAEEQALADARAQASRDKAEAQRLEAEKSQALKAEALKAKEEAQKLEAEKKAEAKQKAAQLKAQKEAAKQEQKKAEVKEEKPAQKAETTEQANKALAEAHIAPAEASNQTEAAVIKQQQSLLQSTPATSAQPASAPSATEEAVEIVDTDKAPTLDSKPASALTKEVSQTETVVTPQSQESTSTAAVTGLPAGSILNPDATSLITSPQTPQLGQPVPEQPGAMTTADTLDIETAHQLGATINEVTSSASAIAGSDGEVPVLDADEQDEVERVVEYENLPTDEGKTRIKTGAKFPVVVLTQLSSKTARNGDAIDARLKYDLKIGDRLIAKKGATVRGHINYALKARSVMHSLVSPTRWYRNSGVLGVEFDEIITEKGEHLPLVAAPAKTARVVNNKAEGRLLGVNHEGQVTGPWSQQLKYKAVRVGLNAAMGPIGVFSFGAMPVALGLIGAANPSFAFMKPVGTNVRHRRIKGFAWGFLSGVPGSFLIEDTVTKGQEAIIKPGDEFLAEFKQEFTGEAASEAQLMPNAQTKVKGDVRTKDKKKDSKDKSQK